jgi:hypothetical protein
MPLILPHSVGQLLLFVLLCHINSIGTLKSLVRCNKFNDLQTTNAFQSNFNFTNLQNTSSMLCNINSKRTFVVTPKNPENIKKALKHLFTRRFTYWDHADRRFYLINV